MIRDFCVVVLSFCVSALAGSVLCIRGVPNKVGVVYAE